MLCVAWLGPRIRPQSVSSLRGQLIRAREQIDRDKFSQILTSGLVLHPREPELTLAAATEALQYKDPKTLTWLNRSMLLAPGWPRTHEIAYLWLWQSGFGRQALLELKQAAAGDLWVAMPHLCKLGAVEAAWVLDVAPEHHGREHFLNEVSACLGNAPTSQAFDDAVLNEFPGSLHPLVHQAQRLLADQQGDESLMVIERIRRAHPEWQPGLALRLNTLLTLERYREVLDEIQRAMPTVSEDQQLALLEFKARTQARIGAPDLVEDTLKDIRRRSTDTKRLAHSYAFEGSIRVEMRQPGAAAAAYQEAFRISNDVRHLWDVGRLAQQLGDRPLALWAYITLCQRDPRSGGCKARDSLMVKSVAAPKSR
jgi:tetratricopeptide (TPR) repeat protein